MPKAAAVASARLARRNDSSSRCSGTGGPRPTGASTDPAGTLAVKPARSPSITAPRPAGARAQSESTLEVGDGRPLAGSRADGMVGALGVEAVDLGVHADRNGCERALQQASHEVG